MSDEAYDASLDILRRLNPKKIKTHLNNICRLAPDLAEEILTSVDTPLEVKRCSESGKNFLICDYNRDGDSYRSPWSNVYMPAADEDAPYPSKNLRALEIHANDSFDIYRDLYYDGGISSIYLWDTEDDENQGFAGVILLKKGIDASKTNSGAWDSVHVFEINTIDKKTAVYKITSTIILDLTSNADDAKIDLSGSLTRQTEKELQFKDSASHIANIGSLVEDIEYKLRNMLQEVYFGKTKDIIGDLRTTQTTTDIEVDKAKHSDLIKGMNSL
ncbi:hypothetical protein PACTADRAFT_72332 [Pachysolen tannophilus NRRL Y-2460]|uniref:F-actin-capping protein subunit beta n=1 Tax=Pachysolen tannophilus NRRL Y-2460 TaxID=669874 RepID=A0A1E4TN89_PACTA|nr:hypothetical protein PACTADRAFT_72332 [Pachysolen tannophilus NRRL Y-2460]